MLINIYYKLSYNVTKCNKFTNTPDGVLDIKCKLPYNGSIEKGQTHARLRKTTTRNTKANKLLHLPPNLLTSPRTGQTQKTIQQNKISNIHKRHYRRINK